MLWYLWNLSGRPKYWRKFQIQASKSQHRHGSHGQCLHKQLGHSIWAFLGIISGATGLKKKNVPPVALNLSAWWRWTPVMYLEVGAKAYRHSGCLLVTSAHTVRYLKTPEMHYETVSWRILHAGCFLTCQCICLVQIRVKLIFFFFFLPNWSDSVSHCIWIKWTRKKKTLTERQVGRRRKREAGEVFSQYVNKKYEAT